MRNGAAVDGKTWATGDATATSQPIDAWQLSPVLQGSPVIAMPAASLQQSACAAAVSTSDADGCAAIAAAIGQGACTLHTAAHP